MKKNTVVCPGCGVSLVSDNMIPDRDFLASAACRKLVFELSYYTLSLGDEYFIHQLAVDAYAAQHSGPYVKPIATTFALVGLYLVNEKHYTGKQVQLAHMALAKKSKIWPLFIAPTDKKWMTVKTVVGSPMDKKEEMIKLWSASVWDAWKPEQEKVRILVKKYLDI
jgi:hypothetical protein